MGEGSRVLSVGPKTEPGQGPGQGHAGRTRPGPRRGLDGDRLYANDGKRHDLSRLYINISLMHRRNKGHDSQVDPHESDRTAVQDRRRIEGHEGDSLYPLTKDCVSLPTWAVATAGVSSAEAIGHLSHQLAHGRHPVSTTL